MRPRSYRYGRGVDQFGELWLPEDGIPTVATVILVHGGFWRARYSLSLAWPLAADLAARGYAVWNLEYRRVGLGGGWPATFTDVAAGIDALAGVAADGPSLDLSRVVAVGHSAGGHLAAWAAGRAALPPGAPGAGPRVALAGVVAQAGVLALAAAARAGIGHTAVTDLMGGGPDDLPDRYRLADPSAAPPTGVPVLCVHARADDEVPFEQSARYVTAVTRAGGTARLLEAPGDHYTLIDPATPDWALVVGALAELVSPPR
ncbi:alpha/beta hydrolase [Frankia sp. CN6]|uniref:Alpha/beta hydrolase n=1 Tax=Frankia nepalensis TaxID=1836974 RepID=A0A937UUU9_9ACTN|nr:alpha/beta hydrolase [Frankia nepalensis]MBL7632625.1 alpha/beta hydrolase [Frankia nepalensis]